MASDRRGEELTAIIAEIRARIRSRHPDAQASGLNVPLPDLLPLLHARDAAEGKVAAIGSVNPRPPGPLNSIIQSVKSLVSRALGWFVRDQVEFNRAIVASHNATLEALNEVNRTFTAIGSNLGELRAEFQKEAGILREETTELKDVRSHWNQWREEWERKLSANEIHFLRGLADLRGLDEQRLRQLDSVFRESTRLQHLEFEGSLRRSLDQLQKDFWADLEKVRLQYEQLIHAELRVLRQKSGAQAKAAALPLTAAQPADSVGAVSFDYTRFADRFRGTEEFVRRGLEHYLPRFRDRRKVLDIGCGRGEFLLMLKEAGVPARGIDVDEESVALCQSRGCEAEVADLFEYLPAQPDGTFDGIFASQVVEHLPALRVAEFISLASARLRSGGILVLETPNPECLAIFATHFYLDPTHQKPLPPQLLSFYMEEAGLGAIEVVRLSEAKDSFPSLNDLPPTVREQFFGYFDYAIIGVKL